jgi:hypothetical protein
MAMMMIASVMHPVGGHALGTDLGHAIIHVANLKSLPLSRSLFYLLWFSPAPSERFFVLCCIIGTVSGKSSELEGACFDHIGMRSQKSMRCIIVGGLNNRRIAYAEDGASL